MTATVRPLRANNAAIPTPMAPSVKALRQAYRNGFDDGDRAGYVLGWRIGMGYGLVYGMAIGAMAIVAAIWLGQALGAV